MAADTDGETLLKRKSIVDVADFLADARIGP